MQTTNSEDVVVQLLTLDHFVSHWQVMLDLLARQADVPCALVNRIDGRQLVVQVANHNGTHPFFASQSIPLQLNSYCANVLRTQKPLHIADATQVPYMHDNPTAAVGLVFYHGYPLYWPDGQLFGTICILDYFNRPMDEQHSDLLQLFKKAIEGDLALFDQNVELQQLQQEKKYNHQIILSLLQSNKKPQLSDLLTQLMQIQQEQIQQNQQQMQLIQQRMFQTEYEQPLPSLTSNIQQLKQQSLCWTVLSGMLQKLMNEDELQQTRCKIGELTERGAYQAALLLRASPRISSTIPEALTSSLVPQMLELLSCALSCYLLSHSPSRTAELSLSSENSESALQLCWTLFYPWQKKAETVVDSSDPFWVFSHYLTNSYGLRLQQEETTEKLEVTLYLALTTS